MLLLLHMILRLTLILILDTTYLCHRPACKHSRLMYLIRPYSPFGLPRTDKVRERIFVRLHSGQVPDKDLQGPVG
jgi:hypothetical protein